MSGPDARPLIDPDPQPGDVRSWTFLTNHGHVLLAVAMDPDIQIKELARIVGITTRHALLILRDLEDAGYVRRERVGRANHYTVHSNRPFRHPTAASHQVHELLDIFTTTRGAREAGPQR